MGGPRGGGGSYEIIDQPLQGNFNGKDFDYASGYVEDSYFEDDAYDFHFYNVEPASGLQPWDSGAYLSGSSYLEVMFTVPKAVGTHELFWDWETGENLTVTLYDPSAGSLNIICELGSIRIDSIDTVSGVISGAMAATQSDDDSDWVNGTFAIDIAPAAD